MDFQDGFRSGLTRGLGLGNVFQCEKSNGTTLLDLDNNECGIHICIFYLEVGYGSAYFCKGQLSARVGLGYVTQQGRAGSDDTTLTHIYLGP